MYNVADYKKNKKKTKNNPHFRNKNMKHTVHYIVSMNSGLLQYT